MPIQIYHILRKRITSHKHFLDVGWFTSWSRGYARFTVVATVCRALAQLWQSWRDGWIYDEKINRLLSRNDWWKPKLHHNSHKYCVIEIHWLTWGNVRSMTMTMTTLWPGVFHFSQRFCELRTSNWSNRAKLLYSTSVREWVEPFFFVSPQEVSRRWCCLSASVCFYCYANVWPVVFGCWLKPRDKLLL